MSLTSELVSVFLQQQEIKSISMSVLLWCSLLTSKRHWCYVQRYQDLTDLLSYLFPLLLSMKYFGSAWVSKQTNHRPQMKYSIMDPSKLYKSFKSRFIKPWILKQPRSTHFKAPFWIQKITRQTRYLSDIFLLKRHDTVITSVYICNFLRLWSPAKWTQ